MAEHEKTFYLKSGKTFSSLKGLAKELVNMPKEVYEHHVNPARNDFSNWIQNSLKNKDLAKKIEGQMNKIELELEVLRHLIHEAEKKPVAKAKPKAPIKKPVVKAVEVKTTENKVSEKPKKAAKPKKAIVAKK